MPKKFYLYSNIFAWGLVLFLIGYYAFGWTTPTANPPSGNITLQTGATPAGSTGYVQFNNAGALGGDAGLFWDNNNKRLGIGTTTPGRPLQVVSTVAGIISAESNSTDSSWIGLKNTSTNGRYWLVGSSGSDHAMGAGKYFIWDNTALLARMVIDTNGNVGIGTPTPAEKLEVAGNIKLSGSSPTYKITNLAAPTASTDAATKGYVDAATQRSYITTERANREWNNCSSYPSAWCPTGWSVEDNWVNVTSGGVDEQNAMMFECWTVTLCSK